MADGERGGAPDHRGFCASSGICPAGVLVANNPSTSGSRIHIIHAAAIADEIAKALHDSVCGFGR